MAKRLQPEEIEYIRNNCLTKSDESIAKALNRDLQTVISARRRLGINKGSAGRVNAIENENPNVAVAQAQASYQLTESERKEYFKTQFVNSLYYTNLKEQFTKEEIDFYLEEWGTLCLQFEDIVATEKRQIDEHIKMTILGFRILRNINAIEEEIKKLEDEIMQLRRQYPDMEKDPMAEEARERDSVLMSLASTMNGQSKSMTIDYQKNLEMRTKLLGELNARRKDRLDQITKRDKTFLGLIQEFRDRQVREAQGRRLELMRQAKDKKKDEWHKPITYIDGTKDCILLDDEAQIPRSDIVYLDDRKCQILSDFGQKKDAKILIVDDDSRRLQFFSDVFKGNKMEFASNAEKAIDRLNKEQFDLICLDYDLGLEQKGTQVVEHILEKNSSPSSRVLIHSMNQTGAKEITARLRNHRKVEVYPFEDLVKLIGDKNAKTSNSGGTDASNASNDPQG